MILILIFLKKIAKERDDLTLKSIVTLKENGQN